MKSSASCMDVRRRTRPGIGPCVSNILSPRLSADMSSIDADTVDMAASVNKKGNNIKMKHVYI